MTNVSILTCTSYDKSIIKNILLQHLPAIGFDPGRFKNKKVCIKPNFLFATPPEKAIITHPVFFRSIAEIVKENGGIVSLIESPAMDSLEKALQTGGYLDTIEDLAINIPDIKETGVLFYEENQRFKRFEISKAYFDMDIIINLPKLKTHGLTTMTCAAKNLFGMIPGLEKSRWHMRARSKEDFSRFIIEFNEALIHGFKKPKTFLHLVDGIIGQEGDGPGMAGTPRNYGITLAGTNAIAVDYGAALFLGINTDDVLTVRYGIEKKFGGLTSVKDIGFTGKDISSIKLKNIKTSSIGMSTDTFNRWPFTTKLVKNILLRWFSKKPVPLSQKCVLCYKCKQICPAKAIDHAKKGRNIPDFNYSVCIRCFCCLEICPEAAIEVV
ncbi:MAG: DUF362 domain-containing protein [Spirochaetales bacterium]|nr:DUF362 domain-containing protein [Spirochaetales bacterium]